MHVGRSPELELVMSYLHEGDESETPLEEGESSEEGETQSDKEDE